MRYDKKRELNKIIETFGAYEILKQFVLLSLPRDSHRKRKSPKRLVKILITECFPSPGLPVSRRKRSVAVRLDT